jgi:protein-disulfide isomerase
MAKRSNRQQNVTSQGGAGGRSRTRERRMERQQEKRRQQIITLVILVVVVAVVAVGVIILRIQPAEAPIPAAALDRYDGIPQTLSEDGFPLLGRVDAPVRFVEYSSFSCPACAEFHGAAADMLIRLVREGIISFTYVPVSTGPIPNAEGANRAALCAREQGAFFEFHDTLFHWQGIYGNQAFSQNRLMTGAENMGLNRSQFESCVASSQQVGNIINSASQVFQERGVGGTPGIFVQGVQFAPFDNIQALEQRIMQALADTGQAPVPLTPTEPEIEEEVTPEAEITPEATEPAEEATPEITPEAEEDE